MAGPSLDGLLNPDMLTWAREQSHMDVATAAQKINQTAERLTEWENGGRVPTLGQLRSLAQIYKRSVGVFFLKDRPRTSKRPIDFRRLELSANNLLSPTLANGIREAEAKRDAALDIFLENEEDPPAWDLVLPTGTSPDEASAIILGRLGITMQMRAMWKSDYEALNGWRAAVESLGVIVVQLSRVSMDEMRGCSLAMYPLPVIVLNGADSPLGRVFTLLHELTHLARNESSLCDIADDVPRSRQEEAVEVYCNHVAGGVLVPADVLLQNEIVQKANEDSTWDVSELKVFRRVFWASREVILRRLLIHGKTSRAYYQAMREGFKKEYAMQREKPSGPVPYYRRVVLSNGRFLTRLVLNAYGSGVITGTELSRILNAKLDHLPKIREALSGEVIA